MFTYKLKFILLSQLIATEITMHVHCIHCLKSAGLFFHCAFADHVNAQLVKWHQWRAQIWQWGPKMAPTVSARLSRLCSGTLAFCGYVWTSYHNYSGKVWWGKSLVKLVNLAKLQVICQLKPAKPASHPVNHRHLPNFSSP